MKAGDLLFEIKKSKSALHKKKDGENGKESPSKKVHFNEKVQTKIIRPVGEGEERTWNDYKNQDRTFVKGQFTLDEINTLRNSICSYVSDKELGIEGLISLCSISKVSEMDEDAKGAWCKIAESLPNRSV